MVRYAFHSLDPGQSYYEYRQMLSGFLTDPTRSLAYSLEKRKPPKCFRSFLQLQNRVIIQVTALPRIHRPFIGLGFAEPRN